VLNVAASQHGVERLSPDASLLLSHALQLRLRTVLEKLSVVAEHRNDIYRVRGEYSVGSQISCRSSSN